MLSWVLTPAHLSLLACSPRLRCQRLCSAGALGPTIGIERGSVVGPQLRRGSFSYPIHAINRSSVKSFGVRTARGRPRCRRSWAP